MRLTHLADYAVVMMTAAARLPSQRWSAASLAAETGVPLATAQKLMQMLARADLIAGQRGAGGGYTLARPIETISLADIIEAVEGPIAMTQCSDGSTDCALDANCRIKPHMGLVGQKVRGALGAVSLQELTQ
ncbi:SUF system Fe-S cluster assembly regulator [Sphingomicrobium sp. XHP0239]|uniref:SUF system Fe-S cluster assembly regulator n=1 Tax=Sphingomicrobium maritimum TaxID=3133972 RepID=UPI0031CCC9BC